MRRYIFVLAIILTLFAAVQVEAFTGKGCGGECRDCHSLTKDEAAKLLKVKMFRAQVVGVEQSPIKGLWAIEISKGGKSFKLYLDYGKKNIIEGSINTVEELGKPPKLKQVDLKKIPLDDALIMGNPNAKYKVIVFSDPDCPYCTKLHKEIKKVLAKRKDVAFYIKLFPLAMHPEAYEKSKTIVCEKKISVLEDAFAGKDIGKPKCKTGKTIDNNIKLAGELGITGTPALILPGGYLYPGYTTAEKLMDLIDETIKDSKKVNKE
jgi:thiol:disulfide interchange protein DsbC